VQHHGLSVLQEAAAGDLLAQVVLMPLQGFRHRIESLRELPELAGARDAGPRREFAGPPCRGRREQPADRPPDEHTLGQERRRQGEGSAEGDQHHPPPGGGVDVGEGRGR